MELSKKRLKAIGTAIAQGRSLRGLTQERLAAMLGYTNRGHLSRVECGVYKPSLNMLFKIADIFEVEVKFFFTEI